MISFGYHVAPTLLEALCNTTVYSRKMDLFGGMVVIEVNVCGYI